MSYNNTLSTIEALQETTTDKIRAIVNDRLKTLIHTFADKYPKRSFGFDSGMGTVFFTIDGHIIHIEFERGTYRVSSDLFFYSRYSDRLFTLLYPMIEFIGFLDNIESPTKCNDYYVDSYEVDKLNLLID